MRLIDTSVWVDHIRAAEPEVVATLRARRALMHPFVLGEIALGNLAERERTLTRLAALRRPALADDGMVFELIDRERLYGSGVGYVDAHLLASTLLTPQARLWTRDRRLAAAAERLGVAA